MSYFNYNTLQNILDDVIKSSDFGELYTQAKIEKKWNDILGNLLDNSVIITDYKDHVLTIKTSSSTWRAEVMLRKEQIIRKLNKELGENTIKEIIIH